MKNKNILQMLKPKAMTSYMYDDSTLRQAVEKMKHHGYTAVPVINREGEYVSTISEGDFLWFILKHDIHEMTDMEDYLVKDIPSKVTCLPVSVNSTIEDLLVLSMNQNFVPVVDDRAVFIGIVTRKDILQVCFNTLEEHGLFSAQPEYAADDI